MEQDCWEEEEEEVDRRVEEGLKERRVGVRGLELMFGEMEGLALKGWGVEGCRDGRVGVEGMRG